MHIFQICQQNLLFSSLCIFQKSHLICSKKRHKEERFCQNKQTRADFSGAVMSNDWLVTKEPPKFAKGCQRHRPYFRRPKSWTKSWTTKNIARKANILGSEHPENPDVVRMSNFWWYALRVCSLIRLWTIHEYSPSTYSRVVCSCVVFFYVNVANWLIPPTNIHPIPSHQSISDLLLGVASARGQATLRSLTWLRPTGLGSVPPVPPKSRASRWRKIKNG